MLSKDVIRNVDLATYEQCGVTIAPRSQVAKLEDILSVNDVEMVLLIYCDRCKKMIVRKSALFPSVWDPIGNANLNIQNSKLQITNNKQYSNSKLQ
jgi:hypothetical protein